MRSSSPDYPGQAAAGLGLLLRTDLPRECPESPESGEATLIRAYTTPVPRAREGRAVAQLGCATAMIDTSDGFLGDLGHICEESGAGAELIQESLPVSGALRRAAPRLGKDPAEFILGPSDDYELIIICPPECVDRVRSAIAATSGVPVSLVGRMTRERFATAGRQPDGITSTSSGWDGFGENGPERGAWTANGTEKMGSLRSRKGLCGMMTADISRSRPRGHGTRDTNHDV